MAATQATLHKFFRATKNVRTPTGIKNSKAIIGDITPESSSKRKRNNPEDSTNRKCRRKFNDEELSEAQTPPTILTTIKNVDSTLNCPSARKKLQLGGTDLTANSTPRREVKKKLNPEEIKALFGKCSRLDELQARLLQTNKCSERLQAFKVKTLSSQSADISARQSPQKLNCHPSPRKTPAHPQLAQFSSLSVEVPVSPSSSPYKTPVKTPLKTPIKTPAYLKFADLTKTQSTDLKLPTNYTFTKMMFRSVETAVSLLYNRQEVITYSKLKPSVQEMMKRLLHQSHLGQIKTVFPTGYKFSQGKVNNLPGSGNASKYELTLVPNMEYKTDNATVNLLSRFDGPTVKFRKMDSTVIVERQLVFHNLLLNILKQHHMEFLKTLSPPVPCNDLVIRRWHPGFLLIDIPDVESADLPQPPETLQIKTARDMLDKAQDLFAINPRMLNAVKDAADKCDQQTATIVPSVPSVPINPALKGVSQSLLAKIRAKQAEKAAREMTRSSTEVTELERISRLPELVRIIRNIFVTEKKAALTWEFVSAKLTASHSSSLSSREVDAHLNLLMKEIPNWCTVHKVRSGIFLKIDKNRQLNEINDKISAIIKERRS